jgi:hypothetical protein
MPLTFSPANHHDRDSLFTEEDRQRAVRERAQLAHVVSHGELSLEEAEALVARDLQVAEAIASHAGLSSTESYMFDQLDIAMSAGMTCADIDVDVSEPLWPALSRARDRIGKFCRELWKFITRPNAFEPKE